MDYSKYTDLKIRRLEPGILELAMGEEGRLSTATARLHRELADVWLDIDRDPETRVADQISPALPCNSPQIADGRGST